ncbi:MAG: hypothetical protein K8R21_07910 [Leptospira sp.]|nr:hypothetical protein [Leptospira sp.]
MGGIYDPKKVNLIIAGKPATGMSQADGFMKIEPMTADYIETQTGIKGENNVSEVYDERWKLTLILMGDSPENEFYFGLGEARAPFPISVSDKSDGGNLGFCAKARVMQKPIVEKGKAYRDRTWVFYLPDYKGVIVK